MLLFYKQLNSMSSNLVNSCGYDLINILKRLIKFAGNSINEIGPREGFKPGFNGHSVLEIESVALDRSTTTAGLQHFLFYGSLSQKYSAKRKKDLSM